MPRSFGAKVSASMHELAMPDGPLRHRGSTTRCPEQPIALGIDRVEFMVTTNPGQPIQPLGKVASGGELSRISLAIVVISAARSPALPLSSTKWMWGSAARPTAAVVEPPVAPTRRIHPGDGGHPPTPGGEQGHQHMVVSKHTDGKTTETQMQALAPRAPGSAELARLLGAIRSPITPWPMPVSCSQS